MNKQFIKIQEKRISLSLIKRYQTIRHNQLNIYYDTSRYKIDVEVFKFATSDKRDEIIETLDLNYGV